MSLGYGASAFFLNNDSSSAGYGQSGPIFINASGQAQQQNQQAPKSADQAIRDCVTGGNVALFHKMIQDDTSLLNVVSGTGSTLLHLVVCGSGSLEIARELIAMGANVCAQNHNKWTSLHYAVSRQLVSSYQKLDGRRL
jgi:hypothetical protein